ncbi:ABC transporter ATP-binding protein [Cellulomonas dongxiuzhuiae]|uniref:ABC transporter ATP-binding protein/permease n=1 Tax=Cellulomonas dongxiuzhuiae TaxID=2819979 RepID=A0ABX8GMF4_9CELL|nr:ABC transporter ATP-binding protein [Cellulomonas dongxiuzhuiae]MBO3087597.1 ABC transporter ATP-binding protein [Cellulomonas dongxiuzhuiae]MBO3096044.1 ABC transporter ATP-binding protein [Cellulomonas dongxiuzhuiae]QWC17319.1 ABC transporter ATP-binding protein/permease [Cellulomonas dongxiuzhuiae]
MTATTVPRGTPAPTPDEHGDHTPAEVRSRSLGLLASLLRPVTRRAVLTALVVVVAQLALVAGPALVALGIDRGIPALRSGDAGPLFLVAGGYAVTALVAGVFTAATVRMAATVSQAVLLDLRGRVFRHTQRLSLEFHERYTSGRIISRQTSDLDALRELLDGGVTTLAASGLAMVFTAVGLTVLDWRSGLVLLVAVVPGVVLTRWFQVRSQAQYRRSRTAVARVIVRFVETMTGIRAVQAFRREQQVAAVYDVEAEEYREANAEAIRVNGVFDTGLVLIGNVTVAAVLLVGGLRVLDGALDVGVLVAAVLYARRFFAPLAQIGMFYNSFQSATAALEKLSGLLAQEPTVADPVHPVRLREPRGDVRFDGVEFGYGDGPAVLPRLDLHVPSGQTVALVGETGAGKSTVAKLLARFYDPRAGAVRLDGVDLREIDPRDLRTAMVMVTQEAYLFSGSVAANIALGRPGAGQAEIERAARAVGVHDLLASLPDGYDTDVDTRGVRLSAGQRQLVSFARAFLADPAVLVLDEATSSLDIPGEQLVQEGLRTLLTGRTAVVIAHRLSTVMHADRVLVVDDGRIVEDGSPEALVAAGGRFATLHAQWQESLRST